MERTAAQWEDRFRSWAGGPGTTEVERCENSERMIGKAIAAADSLKDRKIEVFAQGSYKNLTNIPQESDVDVSVCLLDTFYSELPAGMTNADFGLITSDTKYEDYKRDVAQAISDYFGKDRVTIGNKAIRVHSTTYRVDADVVPNLEFREYWNPSDKTDYRSGVRFYADDGTEITNYPKQHTLQGVLKNSQTAKRFKRMARILKSLQVELLDEKIISHRCPSFFVESLVFNVPNDSFNHDTYTADVRSVLATICNNTRVADDPSDWMEVNNVKYLFRPAQPWSKADANRFGNAAWTYIGYDVTI